MAMERGTTARHHAPAWELVRNAAGSPADLARKLRDLRDGVFAYADGQELEERLRRLHALGLIDTIPSRLQLVVGSIDMLRFWISPAAAEYYAAQNINYAFHQLLRVLDDPTSMIDPTGFLSRRDTIIGHLMQVTHANPAYDLQLLEAYEGGLEELERQVQAMLDGSHPRARSIGAIVEDPGYHARLLGYVRAYRRERDVDAPVRDNVSTNAHWAPIERTFGTLPRAMGYFARMPDTFAGAVRHVLTVRAFPVELAAPPVA